MSEAEHVTAASRSDDIERVESRTDDALRRIRALGVRVDVHEIRHANDSRRR